MTTEDKAELLRKEGWIEDVDSGTWSKDEHKGLSINEAYFLATGEEPEE